MSESAGDLGSEAEGFEEGLEFRVDAGVIGGFSDQGFEAVLAHFNLCNGYLGSVEGAG